MAVFVFASVTFLYVFLATADIFLLAVTAAGFALVYAAQKESRPALHVRGGPGLVLAGLRPLARDRRCCSRSRAAYRLPYLFLLLPAVAAQEDPRRPGRGCRRGAGDLSPCLPRPCPGRRGPAPRSEPGLRGRPRAPRLERRLLPRGEERRNPAVLPAGPPGPAGRPARPLGAGALERRWRRSGSWWRIPTTSRVSEGDGNRLFLPLYAALWFLAAKPVRSAWAVVVALLAAPFLLPLPCGHGAHPAGWLPYEATQRELPGAWISQGGLRIKPTSPSIWKAPKGSDFRIVGGETGELVIASPGPLESLELEFDRNAPTQLAGERRGGAADEARGGRLGDLPGPSRLRPGPSHVVDRGSASSLHAPLPSAGRAVSSRSPSK